MYRWRNHLGAVPPQLAGRHSATLLQVGVHCATKEGSAAAWFPVGAQRQAGPPAEEREGQFSQRRRTSRGRCGQICVRVSLTDALGLTTGGRENVWRAEQFASPKHL
ncbi:hypothetical protein MTO96_013890 [Rhipicephalus appendiculatus]